MLAAHGEATKARRALDRGLRLLDDHRASLGSTELRAQASGHGSEMADLGIRLALDRARPADLLRWAERWRAGALWRRPVVPGELAAELAALRWVRAERAEAAAAGGDVSALLRRESELEAAVRRISRQVAGARPGEPSAPPAMVQPPRLDLRALRPRWLSACSSRLCSTPAASTPSSWPIAARCMSWGRPPPSSTKWRPSASLSGGSAVPAAGVRWLMPDAPAPTTPSLGWTSCSSSRFAAGSASARS